VSGDLEVKARQGCLGLTELVSSKMANDARAQRESNMSMQISFQKLIGLAATVTVRTSLLFFLSFLSIALYLVKESNYHEVLYLNVKNTKLHPSKTNTTVLNKVYVSKVKNWRRNAMHRGKKKKIVLWWSSPHTRSFGDSSSYYNRIGTALENQPEILLCQYALIDCYKTAKKMKLKRYDEGIPLLIGIPHAVTSELGPMVMEISRVNRELEQLTDYLDLNVNTDGFPTIMFCLFLNKIYKNMYEKIASFASLT